MLPGFYLRPEGAKRIWPGAQPPDRRPTGNKPQGGERNSGYRTRNSRCLEVSPLRGLKPLGANPGAAPPAKSFRPHSGPRERNGFVPVTLLQCLKIGVSAVGNRVKQPGRPSGHDSDGGDDDTGAEIGPDGAERFGFRRRPRNMRNRCRFRWRCTIQIPRGTISSVRFPVFGRLRRRAAGSTRFAGIACKVSGPLPSGPCLPGRPPGCCTAGGSWHRRPSTSGRGR